VVGAILAGGSTMQWPVFLAYNAAGAVTWCLAVASAGYFLAYSWATLEAWIGRTGLTALALVILAGIIGFMRTRRDRHS
jgi:membrane-associated protein